MVSSQLRASAQGKAAPSTSPARSNAKPTPSLVDTTDWLSGMITQSHTKSDVVINDNKGMVQLTEYEHYSSATFPARCAISLSHGSRVIDRYTDKSTGKELPVNERQVSIAIDANLSDFVPTIDVVAPNAEYATTWRVLLKTWNGRRAIRTRTTSISGYKGAVGDTATRTTLSFGFEDESLAKRFRAAAEYAIKACGGKTEAW
jgi:hypothetical protein